MPLMKSTWAAMASWAFTMAWYMTSSGIWSAPASIMTTFSLEAATVRSSLEACFWAWLGFRTISPST